MIYDYTIIGAGIVGLSAAWKLSLSDPGLKIAVIDKEPDVAVHQTGRNSGVIHSGIYYKPGSHKAANCVNGRHQLVQFCRDYDVAHDICGKVIVAVNRDEIPVIKSIYERGVNNGVEGIELIGREKLEEIEPHCNGVAAIHVSCAGIVDFKGVCRKLADLIRERGNSLLLNREVTGIFQTNGKTTVETTGGAINTRFVISCSGLHSDKVATLGGVKPGLQVVPFRGEYYHLTKEAEDLVNGLIYPLPNPEFPFLGVHFTRMVHGGVECGPNAVFAFKREGYSKLSFSLRETIEATNYPGFWKLAAKHWRMGLDEIHRSFSKKKFLETLQRLVPAVREEDLLEGESGVRAMALDADGSIVDDFYYRQDRNQLHVLNAPSPAATAGLAIGDEIVRRVKGVRD